MGLYLGGSEEKLKICINGSFTVLNIPDISSSTNINSLLSSDNYILKDSNGLYLISKEV